MGKKGFTPRFHSVVILRLASRLRSGISSGLINSSIIYGLSDSMEVLIISL